MTEYSFYFFLSHLTLAFVLFFIINWIGKHSIDFGYASTTLFEQENESVALNLFIRALSPAVFIILISAALEALSRSEWRLSIVMVVPYYYLIRAGAIFLFNRHRLISWVKYLSHAIFGIAAASIAYQHLILPNRSLIPNLETAGNELWLALLAFLYAVANKIPTPAGPGQEKRMLLSKRITLQLSGALEMSLMQNLQMMQSNLLPILS